MDINAKTPKDLTPEWDDIRPFRDDEIPAAMQRIVSHKDFPKVMEFIYDGQNVRERIREFAAYKTVSQFQIGFMFDAINAIVRKTADSFTYDGFENLEKGKGYLFVSNHRDILLDAALLQIALYNSGLGHLCSYSKQQRSHWLSRDSKQEGRFALHGRRC